MQRSLVRLILLVAAGFWLGSVVQAEPGQLTLELPEKGFSVTLPKTPEGWDMHPGQGDVLATGHTRFDLFSLEIAQVPVATEEELNSYLENRHIEQKQGKDSYIVWHKGTDAKFGLRPALTYKATYRDYFAGLPLMAEHWLYDVYWPHRGQYLRISMQYPDLLTRYVEPDKYMLAAGLKLAQ